MSKTNDTFRELTEANLDAVSLEELESVSGGVELVHEAAHAEVSARPRNSHATLLIRKGVI